MEPVNQNFNSAQKAASLYVGNLSEEVTEAILFEKFSATGTVLSIRVCRDVNTNASLGYAYVNFANFKDAKLVLDTMNYDVLNGKQIRIMWSQRDPTSRKSGVGNVYVKNLDLSVTNKSLSDMFSSYGNILSCKVACDSRGISKGHGFIQFDREESALTAIEDLNGNMTNGQKMFVGKFIAKKDREKMMGEGLNNLFNNNLASNPDANPARNAYMGVGTQPRRSNFRPQMPITSQVSNPYQNPAYTFRMAPTFQPQRSNLIPHMPFARQGFNSRCPNSPAFIRPFHPMPSALLKEMPRSQPKSLSIQEKTNHPQLIKADTISITPEQVADPFPHSIEPPQLIPAVSHAEVPQAYPQRPLPTIKEEPNDTSKNIEPNKQAVAPPSHSIVSSQYVTAVKPVKMPQVAEYEPKEEKYISHFPEDHNETMIRPDLVSGMHEEVAVPPPQSVVYSNTVGLKRLPKSMPAGLTVEMPQVYKHHQQQSLASATQEEANSYIQPSSSGAPGKPVNIISGHTPSMPGQSARRFTGSMRIPPINIGAKSILAAQSLRRLTSVQRANSKQATHEEDGV